MKTLTVIAVIAAASTTILRLSLSSVSRPNAGVTVSKIEAQELQRRFDTALKDVIEVRRELCLGQYSARGADFILSTDSTLADAFSQLSELEAVPGTVHIFLVSGSAPFHAGVVLSGEERDIVLEMINQVRLDFGMDAERIATSVGSVTPIDF